MILASPENHHGRLRQSRSFRTILFRPGSAATTWAGSRFVNRATAESIPEESP